MQFEVEQKFPLVEIAVVQQKLRQLGASESPRVEQIDTYFNHPSRDFAQTDEALRIRQVGQQNFVTYKGPKVDATTKTRREVELPLGDGARIAEQFAEILIALGFRRALEVRKTRRRFHINWQGTEIEAALDEVAGLGTFLELEIAADQSQLDSARRQLAQLAEALGVSATERRSYLELLLAQKKPPA